MNSDYKIKILMITVRADYGGGPEHVYKLLKGLKDDFDFYVACPYDEPYYERYSSLLGKENLFYIPHRKFNLTSLTALSKFIKRNNIGIIHSHGKGAGIYSRLISLTSGITCIHTFHGLHIGTYNSLSKDLYLILERFLALFTYKLVVVSNSERELILWHNLAPSRKVELIENGIEIIRQNENPDVFSKEKLTIISITRFDYQKNSGMLIDIFKELKQINILNKFELLFIGSGPEEDLVKQEVKKNDLEESVRFLGFTSNPMEYLKDAFCYITTSQWEGLPLSILEAMAAGVPVIATNVTGNKDIVEHNSNGFLFDPESPVKAAEYLKILYEDKSLWKTFSENGVKTVSEKFSIHQMLDKTKKLYIDSINKI